MAAAAASRGRGAAYPTGACGPQTFSDGWRSCELRQLKMGCRTWLAPFGLTFPSAVSWVTIFPSTNLSLRSEATDKQHGDLKKIKLNFEKGILLFTAQIMGMGNLVTL